MKAEWPFRANRLIYKGLVSIQFSTGVAELAPGVRHNEERADSAQRDFVSVNSKIYRAPLQGRTQTFGPGNLSREMLDGTAAANCISGRIAL